MLKKLLTPLASLRLTVVLLVLGLLLIFFGTLAQKYVSAYTAQEQYFHSLYVWIPWQIFLSAPPPGEEGIAGGFPFIGGYALGVLLLANLLAAHAVRFKLSWKRSGILLTHLGLILLFVGEGLTSALQVESYMNIEEGDSASYTQSAHETELAIVDRSPADNDGVLTIADRRLARLGVISDSRLPFDVRVDGFHPNAGLFVSPGDADSRIRATAGVGTGLIMVPRDPFSGVGTESRMVNAPAAYISLSIDGRPLGTYLVSTAIDGPQVVQVGDRQYFIELRFKRCYKPYTIKLTDFRFDRYVGSEVARNYSSAVTLIDPEMGEDRDVLIWMNHPLRHRNETIYQHSFASSETGTTLQVVDNPAWIMPYVACTVGGLGLLIHFCITLAGFTRRRFTAVPPSLAAAPAAGAYVLQPRRSWKDPVFLMPLITAILAIIWLGSTFRYARPVNGYEVHAFGRLPVAYNGRVMPLDTLARNTLRLIYGKETLRINGNPMPAPQWLLEVLTGPAAVDHPVFRIDHPDVISLLNLDPAKRYFTRRQLLAGGAALDSQYQQAVADRSAHRSAFQNQIIQLRRKVTLFDELRLTPYELHLAPPLAAGQDWEPAGTVHHGESPHSRPTLDLHPRAQRFFSIISAYAKQQPDEFNAKVAEYRDLLNQSVPGQSSRAGIEAAYNHIAPLWRAMWLYVAAFLLVAASWLFWARPFARAAYALLLITLVLHTVGLAARIHIMGRPPVTNLYSSAIFIAWGGVVLGALLERLLLRNSIGTLVASVVGCISLVIAHNLTVNLSDSNWSTRGDTMNVLMAVLDTNFWLATHVICITLGYASTFLAGLLAIVYVVAGVFTTTLDRNLARTLTRMIYGIICFSLLFSFVGTLLGGIWADQSWGRFWGWDPKENGAAMLVCWLAIILHMRWGGMIHDRGLAISAIFGNVITAWSWFGTNMMGVGLHAYGFMESGPLWMLLFVFSQLVLMTIGYLPLEAWRSNIAVPLRERPQD